MVAGEFAEAQDGETCRVGNRLVEQRCNPIDILDEILWAEFEDMMD